MVPILSESVTPSFGFRYPSLVMFVNNLTLFAVLLSNQW